MLKNIKKAGFQEKKFDTGEIIMNYVVGPVNGLPLVLIPPQSASWENYEEVLLPLAQEFQVFAVDIRGHGKSDWTTGDYSFESIGRDLSLFLKKVVKKPAIISGNSSGGLITVWLAANVPQCVIGIIPEDPPLFSADWPRIQKEFVYNVLKSTVEIVNVLRYSRSIKKLSDAFKKIERPVEGSDKTRKLPTGLTYLLSFIIRIYQCSGAKKSIDITFFPSSLRKLVKYMSTYDPDFSRAWVDGRIYQGLDHEEALKRVQCPMLLLHANWFRDPVYGLVGAMDDDDAARACELVPSCQYKRIDSDHVIHSHQPQIFVQEIKEFIAREIHNQP